jgi:hypothetical protein
MSHTCHAADCDRVVPPRLLMCLKHWRMVPGDIQRMVLVHYNRGQEVRKDPTEAYLAVQALAIAVVAKAEGLKEQAYQAMIRSMMHVRRLPDGDPYNFIRGRVVAEVSPKEEG